MAAPAPAKRPALSATPGAAHSEAAPRAGSTTWRRLGLALAGVLLSLLLAFGVEMYTLRHMDRIIDSMEDRDEEVQLTLEVGAALDQLYADQAELLQGREAGLGELSVPRTPSRRPASLETRARGQVCIVAGGLESSAKLVVGIPHCGLVTPDARLSSVLLPLRLRPRAARSAGRGRRPRGPVRPKNAESTVITGFRGGRPAKNPRWV